MHKPPRSKVAIGMATRISQQAVPRPDPKSERKSRVRTPISPTPYIGVEYERRNQPLPEPVCCNTGHWSLCQEGDEAEIKYCSLHGYLRTVKLLKLGPAPGGRQRHAHRTRGSRRATPLTGHTSHDSRELTRHHSSARRCPVSAHGAETRGRV